MTLIDINEAFDALQKVVESYKNAVEEGKLVDMGLLEKDIATLCEGINKAGPDDTAHFQKKLNALSEAIGELEHVMTTKRDEAKAVLESISTQKKAQGAYITASHMQDES